MDRWAETCPCSCHGGGPYASCDEDGGCGYLHRGSAVDQDDPHARRCARKGDCPGYQRVEVDDDKRPGKTVVIRIGAPLEQDRGLCRVCRDVTAGVVGKLEDDYWKLYAELGSSQNGAMDSDVVRGTRELPIPIRTSIRDLAARIVTVAVTWAEPVAEQAQMEWDACMVLDHTRPHAALAKAVRVLRWNVSRLVDHEPVEVRAWGTHGYVGFDEQDGVSAAVELCQLHDRVETILGLSELRHNLPAPCPNCEGASMTLFRDNGDDHVYCSRCNISYPEIEYKRLTLVLADDYRAA